MRQSKNQSSYKWHSLVATAMPHQLLALSTMQTFCQRINIHEYPHGLLVFILRFTRKLIHRNQTQYIDNSILIDWPGPSKIFENHLLLLIVKRITILLKKYTKIHKSNILCFVILCTVRRQIFFLIFSYFTLSFVSASFSHIYFSHVFPFACLSFSFSYFLPFVLFAFLSIIL